MIISNRKRTILGLLAVSLVSGGCSGLIKGTAVEGTTLILQDAQIAFFEEEDYTLARDAYDSTMDRLGEAALFTGLGLPRQVVCFLGGYAFGFVEEPQLPSFTGSEPWAKRASILYRRGMGYGLRILERNDWFKRTFKKDMDGFANVLRESPERELPALFWTAYNWANWINLNKSDPTAISDLAWVELMMNRAKEIDETYHHGGPLMFQMVYYGRRPTRRRAPWTRASSCWWTCSTRRTTPSRRRTRSCSPGS